MLPLHDNIPSRTTPFINYTMIAICAIVFLNQVGEDPQQPSMVEKYGMIPARVHNPDAQVEIVVGVKQFRNAFGQIVEQHVTRPAVAPVIAPWLTLLTCVFLHGGWMHFLGNMWFLHIFGDNIEDRFGHIGYALFYLGCGVAASLVHYVSDPTSTVPTIGASGAIAGVMGAYFVWYPGAKVEAVVPIGPFLQMMTVPAPLFLGFWFLLQFLQGAMSSAGAGGVAWWAHIGGFLAGAGAAMLLGKTPAVRAPNPVRRPYTERNFNIHRLGSRPGDY